MDVWLFVGSLVLFLFVMAVAWRILKRYPIRNKRLAEWAMSAFLIAFLLYMVVVQGVENKPILISLLALATVVQIVRAIRVKH